MKKLIGWLAVSIMSFNAFAGSPEYFKAVIDELAYDNFNIKSITHDDSIQYRCLCEDFIVTVNQPEGPKTMRIQAEQLGHTVVVKFLD